MNSICIVVTPDSEPALCNISPEDIGRMLERGWKVYRLGLADPDTMPGILARGVVINPRFQTNIEMVRV